jgi:hypothetical protein
VRKVVTNQSGTVPRRYYNSRRIVRGAAPVQRLKAFLDPLRTPHGHVLKKDVPLCGRQWSTAMLATHFGALRTGRDFDRYDFIIRPATVAAKYRL